MAEFTKEDLKEFQSESLTEKIQRSLAKIGEWYSYWDGNVYVSFSGGKDSSVLADLCALWCKLIGAKLYLLFVNTGLEYPEIQKHVKFFAKYLEEKYGIEVELDIVRPDMRFDEVIKTYGYPLISKEVSKRIREWRSSSKHSKWQLKRWEGLEEYKNSQYKLTKHKPLRECNHIPISDKCCEIMKKKPAQKYERKTGRKPILATMAEESKLRETTWLRNGCNAFYARRKTSQPMSFWTNQDILLYIKERELPIPSVYGSIEYAYEPEQIRWSEIDPEFAVFESEKQKKLTTTGCDRTGCVFCPMGTHLEKTPTRFQRLQKSHSRQYSYCIGGGEYDEDGVWRPNKKGLGLGHVFDELNKIYGEGFIRYKEDSNG